MADSLTDEQRGFVIAQARNTGGAIAITKMLAGAGFGPMEIIMASLTAATAAIERTYVPGARLGILNEALAETIHEWADAAAAAAGGAVRE